MIAQLLHMESFSDYKDFQNNFGVLIPENFNFGYDIIDVWAKKEPSKRALLWIDSKGNEIKFTFADIKKYSDLTAAYLHALGINRGDCVLLMLKRHYQWWITMIALHKLGAIAVPSFHNLKAEEITFRCNQAGVKAIISLNESGIIKEIETASADCHNLKLFISVGGKTLNGWHNLSIGVKQKRKFERPSFVNSNRDTMLIYFTSGTTGIPKMVAHDYLYPLAHIWTAIWLRIKEGKLHFTLSDSGWGKAAWGKLYAPWVMGAEVFAIDFEKFSGLEILKAISKYKVDSICAPPVIYNLLCQEKIYSHHLSNLKYCMVAGETLNSSLVEKWKMKTGKDLIEGYGQTETALIIGNFPFVKHINGSIGKANPLYDVYIVKENDEPCQPFEIGEIVIKLKTNQLGLFKGYLNDNYLTQDVIKNQLYHTRDSAYMDDKGYFWYVSRMDGVIKSSGYRIDPKEIENLCMLHPAVKECVITSDYDEVRGQIVKAAIVLAEEFKDCDSMELVKEIKTFINKKTSSYKCPRTITFVSEIPKTSSGKINYSKLQN